MFDDFDLLLIRMENTVIYIRISIKSQAVNVVVVYMYGSIRVRMTGKAHIMQLFWLIVYQDCF